MLWINVDGTDRHKVHNRASPSLELTFSGESLWLRAGRPNRSYGSNWEERWAHGWGVCRVGTRRSSMSFARPRNGAIHKRCAAVARADARRRGVANPYSVSMGTAWPKLLRIGPRGT